jgi:hypothetical protein
MRRNQRQFLSAFLQNKLVIMHLTQNSEVAYSSDGVTGRVKRFALLKHATIDDRENMAYARTLPAMRSR